MPYTVTVQYPADAQFKMDYYTSSHMPMVAKEFEPYGFKGADISIRKALLMYIGYQVSENLETPDPSQPSPYSVLCLLFFNDKAGYQQALEKTGEKVLGDIPNFSDKGPIIIGGENNASSVSI